MGTWFEAISMGHPLVPVLLRDSLSTRLMDKHINTASLHKHMLWWCRWKKKKNQQYLLIKKNHWLWVTKCSATPPSARRRTTVKRLHTTESLWNDLLSAQLQNTWHAHSRGNVFCVLHHYHQYVGLTALQRTGWYTKTVDSEFHLPHDLCLHSSVLWFGSRKFQRLWSCGWKHRPFTSFMLKHVAKNQSIAVFQPTRRSHGEGSLLLHSNNRGGLNWALRKRTEHCAPSSRPELRRRCSSEPRHRLQGQTSCAEAAKGQGRSVSIYYWCPLAKLSLVKVDIARTSLQPSYIPLQCECAAR